MENNSNKPCTRGHHKRRKKNARSRFDRCKMMNVADSRQTRRTLVYSHPQSPQQISSQTAACCCQNIGKSSVLQGGRGLQRIGWSNCICYPRLRLYTRGMHMLVTRRFLIRVMFLQDFDPSHWLTTNFQIWSRLLTMQFYAQAIQMRNLSQHARIKEDVWEEQGEMEMWLHSLTNLPSR